MQILVPKYRQDPNAKVHSMYQGVATGGRTVTTLVKPSVDRNRLEATRVYGPGLVRGAGGRVAVLVLGGMETSLDEVQDILAMKWGQKFVPRRNNAEIVAMCRRAAERRNERIEAARAYFKRNPSELPKTKRRVRLHLPVGVRYVQTNEPGLKILARV